MPGISFSSRNYKICSVYILSQFSAGAFIYNEVHLTYICPITQFCKVLSEFFIISVAFENLKEHCIVHELEDFTAHSLLQVTNEGVE